jgi:hypothetical protein
VLLFQVVMEKEELFGEELEIILDRYPASMSPQAIEEEEEPGVLPPVDSGKDVAEIADWRHPDEQDNSHGSVGRDESVDKWSVAGVRSMDPIEVERISVDGSSGDESKSADGRWSDLQSQPNGTAEAQRKEALDRGESWNSSLEEGDVAATNRSGFGESSPDTSIAAPVSIRGKNDIHDKFK